MQLSSELISLQTAGDGDIHDITDSVSAALCDSGIGNGLANIFIGGATGGITTLEAEPGAMADLQACFARLAPRDIVYQHNEAYHDGNGHSHVQAALMGPEITIPIKNNSLLLGTWQKIIFVDFDNRPRQREIMLHFMGE